jgi:hypothetical protein
VDAEARFNEIADDLAAQNDDVELGKMFGMPTIKRGGKATSGFWKGYSAEWPRLAQDALSL